MHDNRIVEFDPKAVVPKGKDPVWYLHTHAWPISKIARRLRLTWREVHDELVFDMKTATGR